MLKYVNSATIRSSLDRRGIPYTQHHQRSRVDITQCFDEASEDGRLLLDFLTHVLRFKETASEELQKEVMEYLASSNCSEKTSEGQVLFNNDWDAVVFGKPLE